MVTLNSFLTENPNAEIMSPSCAEHGGGSGYLWMGRNKCFVLESFAAVDEGAGSDRIEDMHRRWSKAVDVFLFLIHYKKEAPSSDAGDGDCNDDTDDDAVSQFKATWYDKLKDLHTDPQTRHYHTMVHLAEMFGFLDMLLPDSPAGAADGILSAEVLARQRAAPIRAMLEAVSTMATFFHDAVYDATSSTNEEDSAQLFRDFARDLKALADGGDDDATPRACALFDFAVDWVGRYILSTKSHSATINGENADDVDGFGNSKGVLSHLTRYFSRHMLAFLDADMAVLAKQSEAYDAYAGLIRKEYIHVPRDVYCQKRAEVLESFLVDPMTGKTKFIFATDAMRTSYELKAKDNLQKEIASLKSGVIPCEDIVEDREIENETGSDGVLEEEVNGNDSDIAKESKDNDAHAGSFDESDINKQEDDTMEDSSDVVDDLAPGWETLHDPNSGREYYYNSQTGDTVWDKPVIPQEELAESNIGHSNALAADDSVQVEEPSEEIESNAEVPVADTIVDSDSPSKQADGDEDEEVEEQIAGGVAEGNVLPNGWQELTDDSGNLYYYNAETGETSWTRPTSDFSSDEAGVNTSHDSKNSAKEEENEEEVVNEQTTLPDGWTSLTDEASGRIYFYNEGTGETSWDRPVDNVAGDSINDDLTKDAILVNTGVASESDPGIAAADLFAQPHIAHDAFAEPASDVDVPTTTEVKESPSDTANDGIVDTNPPEDADDNIVEAIPNDAAVEDAVNPFTEEPPSDSFASSAFDQPAPAESSESDVVESNAADVFAAPSPANNVVSGGAAALSSNADLVHDGSVEDKKEVTLEDTSTDVPPLSAGWTELIDESSGRVYYYNGESGITSWDRPSVPSSGPPDTAEEASSNNLPIDDVVESESESLEDVPTTDAGDYFPEEDKEDIAQNTSSEPMGGLDAQPLDQVQESPLPEGWEQLVDPTSGNPYYYCKIDGTTSWDKPVM